MNILFRNIFVSFVFISISSCALAQIPLDINTTVGSKIYNIPENSWVKLNSTNFDSVWTPKDQQTLDGWNKPVSILTAWSSMAWDSKRGKLIFWGGGHANYSGNETYLWNSVSGKWERGSLPTDIVKIESGLYHAKGGIMTAPIANHTYDNSEYLPISDRFITFGGASFNTGGPFIYINKNGIKEQTGPYLWDPSKADMNKTGGIDGSQVKPSIYPGVMGGNMWENRNNITIIKPLILQPNGTWWPNRWWGEGTSAYSYENKDVDTIYISDIHELYKYTIVDISDPSKDILKKVGEQGAVASGQGAGAYDPLLNRFVRTFGRPSATMDSASTFAYWDLNATKPKKVLFRPIDVSGGFDIGNLENFGMDYDPKRNQYILWDGSDQVWAMTAPTVPSANGWVIQRIYSKSINLGTEAPTKSIAGFIQSGILGKWKYVPSYDVFLGVNNATGDIWAYKPINWNPLLKDSSDVIPPEVVITEPFENSVLINEWRNF